MTDAMVRYKDLGKISFLYLCQAKRVTVAFVREVEVCVRLGQKSKPKV